MGLSRLPFPDVNVPIDRFELDFRPATVDRAYNALVKYNAVSTTVFASIFHHRRTWILFQADLEIAVDGPVLAFEFDLRFNVGRQRDVDVAVERAERHRLVGGDLVHLSAHLTVD